MAIDHNNADVIDAATLCRALGLAEDTPVAWVSSGSGAGVLETLKRRPIMPPSPAIYRSAAARCSARSHMRT